MNLSTGAGFLNHEQHSAFFIWSIPAYMALLPWNTEIQYMEEILHHLGCIKPCKYWDKLPSSTGDRRISEPSTVPTPLARPCWVWNLASTKGGPEKSGHSPPGQKWSKWRQMWSAKPSAQWSPASTWTLRMSVRCRWLLLFNHQLAICNDFPEATPKGRPTLTRNFQWKTHAHIASKCNRGYFFRRVMSRHVV